MNLTNIENFSTEQIEDIYHACLEYANKIINPDLRKCCLEIYADYKDKLIAKPATGDPCHHFYKGGLIYHSYCVTRNAITIAQLYPYINLDLDLIIFGSLLHDIGKTNDYKNFDEIKPGEYGNLSSAAYMVGHSYEGCHIVQNYIENYNFDDKFKYQILHMIGSHMHDFGEFGVLTSPKMLEVLVINYGDSIDAHLDKARNGINNSSSGELYFNENKTAKFYKSANPYYNKSTFI